MPAVGLPAALLDVVEGLHGACFGLLLQQDEELELVAHRLRKIQLREFRNLRPVQVSVEGGHREADLVGVVDDDVGGALTLLQPRLDGLDLSHHPCLKNGPFPKRREDDGRLSICRVGDEKIALTATRAGSGLATLIWTVSTGSAPPS